MSKATQTEKFYRTLLESNDVKIDDDNDSILLYGYGEDGAYEPIRIDGKIVVLPTYANLKKKPEFWKDKISFHPIVEQSLRTESKVFRTLQSLLNWKLINSFSYVAHNLALLASHPEIPKKFNPNQHVILDSLKDANKRTVKFIKDILDASFEGDKSRRLISTAVKQGGRYKGKQHSAVLITLFSLFDNVNNDSKSIFGIKAPRNVDLEQAIDLFRFIFPKSESMSAEAYNYGSNDDVAPRLHAMLGGHLKMADRLNYIMNLYGEFIEGAEDEIIDTEWSDFTDEFKELKYDIPVIEDNYGENEESQPESDVQSGKKISHTPNDNELDSADTITQTTHYTNPNRNTSSNKSTQTVRKNTMSFDFSEMFKMQQMQQMMEAMSGGNGKGKKKGNDQMNQMQQMMMMQNMMGGDSGSMNPMMMAMMGGDGFDMQDMYKIQLLQNDSMDAGMKQMMAMQIMQDDDASPMLKQMAMQAMMGGEGGSMNPMMMMGMMNGNGDNDVMSQMMQMEMMKGMMGGDSGGMNPMMMMSMMGDNNPFANMFGKKKAKGGETVTPEQPEPKKGK